MNKFLVLKGNHSNVIRESLLKRGNWEEVKFPKKQKPPPPHF